MAADPAALTERLKGTLSDPLAVPFVGATPEGLMAELTRSGTVRAESTPLHRGKCRMVGPTRVTDAVGRLLSVRVQTQMVGTCAPTRPGSTKR